MNLIEQRMYDHGEVWKKTAEQSGVIEKMGLMVREALEAGHKILFCGNGGSAADAQHLAAELIGRFQKERPSMAGIALTTDTSILTAIGNDYGYERVFSRQVEGLGQAGDVLVGISTSGNSKNVVLAVHEAKKRGLKTIGMTGEGGGILAEECDLCFCVPSTITARIQEMHILAGHIICEMAEE